MQHNTAEAIVLDVLDLHDYDRIVVFLTRWKGQKRGVAQGARRKYSRFGGQLQPLAKVKVSWREKDGRELVRISSVEMIRPAEPLQSDLEGLLLSSYLRDHIMEFAQEDDPDDHLYRLLDATILALLEGVDRNLATRYFEAWVLRLAGIFPAPWRCPECEQLLPKVGAVLPPHADGLVCSDCAGSGGLSVDTNVLEFLLRIGRHDLTSLADSVPQGTILDRVAELCALVRRRFLQHELKSYSVIRETLQGLEQNSRANISVKE
jgi:DNA repair protein RecO